VILKNRFKAHILTTMSDTIERSWSDDWREWVTDKARGLVLEIGAGDGVNFSYYHSDALVIATEPDAESLELITEYEDNVTLAQVSAEELPFPDASFDAVVGTLVFCTIPDAPRALQEVKRVLKPGGSIRLVEHVRAKNPLGRAFMQVANPAWHWMTGGCNINRDTLSAVRAAGFQVLGVKKQMMGLILGIDARK
jgi:ubiquinone/menaquinone biosynthesis C-methylase UbiE